MNSHLVPKSLRYFLAVVEHGSVQAAAREIAISASAIDRQILLLEEDMGVALFDRQPRGMRQTAAGELLLAMAKRWKTDLHRTKTEISRLKGLHHGHLRLVAMDSHANGLLPYLINALAREHPGISLEVKFATPDEAMQMLVDDEADLAVSFNVRARLQVHVVWSAQLPLGCAVGNQHALANKQNLRLQDIVEWPLVVQSRTLSIRRYLERRHPWLYTNTKAPLTTNSLQLLKNLVCTGSHIALTSELDVAPEILERKARFLSMADSSLRAQTISVAFSASRLLPSMTLVAAKFISSETERYLIAVRQASASNMPAV
jgi:DNA-binding transcriptional LysR family regulator